MRDYRRFLSQKRVSAKKTGFTVLPDSINRNLFPWQADLVRWAIERGRSAFFWDCGLGKTIAQLEWARHVYQHTGKPVLILAPILVGWQTIKEAEKFQIDCRIAHADDDSQVIDGINVTNYERIHKFDMSKFHGVVLDESSSLKNYMGVRKRAIINAFRDTPFKLSCTATPAPNDLLELGNQADFLNVMPSNEMIARWFVADSMHAGQYRLRKHGAADYWRWVSSWAVSLGSPADIGHEDSRYVLPPLNIIEKIVDSSSTWFGKKSSNASATNIHGEKRDSLFRRCQAVADLVNNSSDQWAIWCGTDYEADELAKCIHDSVEIRGKHSDQYKEKGLRGFQEGKIRNIITKPKIGGWGLNWQHCHKTTWFASYSFEEFYQAIRRLYRFGQLSPVDCHVVASEQELNIVDTIKKKIAAHDGMKCEIADAMRTFQIAEIYGTKLEKYQTCQKLNLPKWMNRNHLKQESSISRTDAAGRCIAGTVVK